MPIATQEQAAAAALGFDKAGPLGDLAVGRVPDCFARLRLRIQALLRESQATEAMLHMEDGPADALMERGQHEMAEISRSLRDLGAWVDVQRCAPSVCDCRADRLLRHLLSEARVPQQTGVSQKLKRPVCVLAGHYDSYTPDTALYVRIDHLNNIEHAVRLHRGWRARLVTPDGMQPVYESPGYPQTPVNDYYDDTQACVRAVADALGSRKNCTASADHDGL
ncbi:hypothetical protein [Streptomyces sp. MT206]|uniref:hypothetical protein n=1 Tax=Streptomyces sp. MT206 TaxID=3031407 RepID=UPI002FCA7195